MSLAGRVLRRGRLQWALRARLRRWDSTGTSGIEAEAGGAGGPSQAVVCKLEVAQIVCCVSVALWELCARLGGTVVLC